MCASLCECIDLCVCERELGSLDATDWVCVCVCVCVCVWLMPTLGEREGWGHSMPPTACVVRVVRVVLCVSCVRCAHCAHCVRLCASCVWCKEGNDIISRRAFTLVRGGRGSEGSGVREWSEGVEGSGVDAAIIPSLHSHTHFHTLTHCASYSPWLSVSASGVQFNSVQFSSVQFSSVQSGRACDCE